jgi:hypothetical protein
MRFYDIDSEDWLRIFSGGQGRLSSSRRAGSDAGGINKNKRRMSEEQLKYIQTRVPKEIVREYQTPEDSKVKKNRSSS